MLRAFRKGVAYEEEIISVGIFRKMCEILAMEVHTDELTTFNNQLSLVCNLFSKFEKPTLSEEENKIRDLVKPYKEKVQSLKKNLDSKEHVSKSDPYATQLAVMKHFTSKEEHIKNVTSTTKEEYSKVAENRQIIEYIVDKVREALNKLMTDVREVYEILNVQKNYNFEKLKPIIIRLNKDFPDSSTIKKFHETDEDFEIVLKSEKKLRGVLSDLIYSEYGYANL